MRARFERLVGAVVVAYLAHEDVASIQRERLSGMDPARDHQR